MKRLVVLALVASLGNAAAAFAGEGILASGARHVQEIAATEPAAAPATTVPTSVKGQAPVSAFQAQGATLSKSGMSRSKKLLIYAGLAAGFAAGAYTIDHKVLNVTPSSLGTRKDGL